MTPAEIETIVRAIVGRVAPNVSSGFSADSDLYREVGVKSLAALDLLLSLEEQFGVCIEDESFGEARSVATLVALIARLVETRELVS
jgi:acyl carrier protein